MENLWSAFADVSARQPNAPALIFTGQQTTFAELKAMAQAGSALLARHGVSAGKVVALQLPKRTETYALLLGCLRLGAPYVFIDPKNPPERTRAILDRVQPTVLFSAAISDNPHGHALPPPTAEMLASEGPAGGAAAISGDDPAYIMFTSGSTGQPKGAVIPHRGVLHLMAWARRDILSGAPQRFTGINPLHFDNSVFDIYCGLLNGAALVPIETGEQSNPAAWTRMAREGEASVMFAVPTLFLILDSLGLLTPAALPSVRAFVFGGEGYPLSRLREFHDRFACHARLINVYGPTETSCICSSIVVDDALMNEAGDGFVSLGRMHDVFSYSVGEPGNPVAPGQVGELWIGGPCVGLGYYRNPEETARRFVRTDAGMAYYRSGDMVRDDAERRLHFVGRTDNQVKIRGHRIELEEIDAVVESVPGIRRAVTAALVIGEETELHVAYTGGAAREDILTRCRDRLPAYMRPSRVVRLDSLPLNANGKVDRLAAKALLTQA
jgi:D-alanine--poly(phosphoribitol) ligase subunit 1